MQLSRPRRRPAMMGLTPLIDMIFLLLLFFLLGSDFVDFGQSRLAPPRGAGGAEGTAPPAIVTLAADGALSFNGAPIDAVRLAREAALLAGRHDDQLFVLMPNGAAPVQAVSDTLDLLAGAGAGAVTLERDVFDIDLADF